MPWANIRSKNVLINQNRQRDDKKKIWK
jgi:hypothetical protein